MKTLLLLVGALACAQAFDLNAISSTTDALSYILNLKCIQAQFYSYAAHGTGLDIGLLGFKGEVNSSNPKVLATLDGHMDYKTSCQEYKDCPGACQDQACKDLCALKTCYYYHCDTYKSCWDACADQGCRDQCSYKGCSYGLTDGLQGAIAKDAAVQGQVAGDALKTAAQTHNAVDKAVVTDAANQQKVADKAVAGAAQAQTAVDTVIIKDVAEQQAAIAEAQKGIDKALIGAAKVVAKDVETQQQFLAHFVGGEKAKLSWFVQLIAEQLAWAEAEHVKILRELLGNAAPQCPHLDISVDTFDALIKLALQGAETGFGWNKGAKFSPYYDDISFMAAVFLFEDLSVSAYAGVMAQFQADVALQLEVTKILSVDSYQSGLVRSWLFNNGAYPVQWFSDVQVIDFIQKISDLRYKLGAGKDEGITIPKAQGGVWVPQLSTPLYKLAIAPTDEQGLIWDRKPIEVADILYGGDYQKPGLFFPQGWNFGL